jgi:ABC-type sugar transport system ATPase subunit
VVDNVTPFYAERYQLVEVHLDRDEWQLTVPLETQIDRGSTIHCTLDPAGIMFFDSKTGARVG